MSDRDRRLQSVGSPLGRAAGHGVLYGVLQREAVLYVNEAREKVSPRKTTPGRGD